VCGKGNVKSRPLRHGESLGEEISSNLKDPTEQMESTHNTLLFQSKHYKKMLSNSGALIAELKDVVLSRDSITSQLKRRILFLQQEQQEQQQQHQQHANRLVFVVLTLRYL